MINGVANNLKKERIEQLISAVGSKATEVDEKIETIEFNWYEPHYFSSEQQVKLAEFAERLSTSLCKKFTNLCRISFEVTIISTTQHYANEFFDPSSTEGEKNYYVTFGVDKEQQFGLIGIPEQTAIIWTRQLLGDSESNEDSNKEFSQLEESLLLDLASALIKTFFGLIISDDFHLERNIVKGQWPLAIQGTEELCKISFNVKKSDSENISTAYFLIPCNKLEPVIGKNASALDNSSDNNIHKKILDHLGLTPVNVTAQLSCSYISFEEIMSLRVNDIVVLDRKVDEPIELVLEGQTVCYGWPGKSSGEYVLKISKTSF